MRWTEPPRLATWMLEHLASGERDEALAGDLLEDFRAGRSAGWYWRQVLGACGVSWFHSLRDRGPLLIWAFLWSMLAPAWTVLSDRIENNAHIFSHLWQLDWPFSALSRFAVWMALNLVFLWGGILVYTQSLTRLVKISHRKKLNRALALAASVFLPIYMVTIILMNLYAYPGLEIHRSSITPLAEITDLAMWADVLRIPYFITLVCAMWGAAPRARRLSPAQADWADTETSARLEALALVRTLDPFTVKRFFAFVVGAGLINAMIVGVLLCRLPDSHAPGISPIFVRAAIYVALGALAGIAGAWLYWKNPSSPFRACAPLPFPMFALVCAAGWVWVPAMVIFSEQLSAAAAVVAMIGAYVLATGLRNATFPVFTPAPAPVYQGPPELFAETLYRAPFEVSGYAIALSLFAAGWAIHDRSYYTAAFLLAAAGFLFAWKKTVPRMEEIPASREYRRLALRLARIVIPAVLVTVWALLAGVFHRNQADTAWAAGDESAKHDSHAVKRVEPSAAPGGFESVILWPIPPKKQIIPPVPAPANYLGLERSRRMIIRFDGAYWYFQPPDTRPGRTAHQAHGSPLAMNIESNNSLPLIMEAHQHLIGSVRLSRCAELDVQIENHDDVSGALELAVLLADSDFPNKPSFFLGEKPVETSQPALLSARSLPAFETLKFAIPPQTDFRKFDEITVMLLPNSGHSLVGPKIAIEQFELFPR